MLFFQRPPALYQSELGFDIRKCKGIYLDVGSNIGVQIRKLYDPESFPDAPVLAVFDQVFGPPPRRDICALGFEPNIKHTATLKGIEQNLKCRGYKAKFFTETAVSTTDSTLTFYGDEAADEQVHEWGASLINWQGTSNNSTFEVRGLDFSRFLKEQIFYPFQQHLGKPGTGNGSTSNSSMPPILMKMDIEGAEFEVLPQLVSTGAFCQIDSVFIEWHEQIRAMSNSTSLDSLLISQFLEGIKPFCKPTLMALDDESYGQGSPKALPACA